MTSCSPCSFMMEYDIHTVLDFLTLGATAWVIYTLRMPLKDTYQAEQDSVQTYYVVSHLAQDYTYHTYLLIEFLAFIDPNP